MSQPHLQRQADERYRRHEMHTIPKSWKPPRKVCWEAVTWIVGTVALWSAVVLATLS